MLQHPNIWAFNASSSLKVNPTLFNDLSWDWVILSDFISTSARFSLDLSINAAISVGSKISFFSNSDTCFTFVSSTSGFCLSSTCLIFSTFWSGIGIASGLIFLTFFGGACSDTSFFSSSLIFSIIFFALGAKGIFVFSEIWISSTDINGGKSKGFLATKGKLTIVKIIINAWKADDNRILLDTLTLFIRLGY